MYTSFENPPQKTVYTCSIEQGPEEGPIFKLVADDSPEHPLTSTSPSQAWKLVQEELAKKTGKKSTSHVSGPDFFGLSNLGVIKYIQELPNADKCRKYLPQKWLDVSSSSESNTVDRDELSSSREDLDILK